MEFLSLLPILAQVGSTIPKLMDMFAGPTAGSALQHLGDAARKVFGTTDPESIKAEIARDQSKAELLKVEFEERTKELQAYLEDVQDARRQTVELGKVANPIAWGAPAISFITVVGFFILLGIFIGHAFDLPEWQRAFVNTMMGYVGAQFQQVGNYWLGSTQQSKVKDSLMGQMATATSERATATIKAVAAKVGGGNGTNGGMFK